MAAAVATLSESTPAAIGIRGQTAAADPGDHQLAVSCCYTMTIEEDRSEVERIAVSWQDVPSLEQEAMLARLGAMLEYLDPAEDAEFQLRQDAARLIAKIEASLGR